MTIYFLTTQEELCRQIAQRLHEGFGYTVQVFTSARLFYEAAVTAGPSCVDLLACDYMAYEADEINPYELMEVQECIIPFFYYNTPYIKYHEHLSQSWYQKMKQHQAKHLGADRLFGLLPALVNIEKVLMAADILPSVVLLGSLLGAVMPPASLLENFKQMHKVQRSRFEVLSYLFAHKNQEIPERELCLYIWHEYTPQRVKALYSYVSDLRRMCREEKDGRMSIARAGKKCYCLTVV